MKLWEINEAILALVDEETGEILDYEAFEALQMAKDEKVENMVLWYKNLRGQIKLIKDEEDALKARRQQLERLADNKLDYIERTLCGTKFETARCQVTFRKTTKVELMDENAAVEWAQKNGRDDVLKYTAPTVSKTEMAKILKAGVEVPGAVLVSGLSMGVK